MSAIQDDETLNLSRRIFGELAGTEALLGQRSA
jgi:hypothetical protein